MNNCPRESFEEPDIHLNFLHYSSNDAFNSIDESIPLDHSNPLALNLLSEELRNQSANYRESESHQDENMDQTNPFIKFYN